MNRLIIAFLLFNSTLIFAQSDHADCESAMHMEGHSVIIEGVGGPGHVAEIAGNHVSNNQYFTDEHNTIWIKFSAPHDGELTFDIVPQNIHDDWNFLLFEAGEDDCDKIKNKEIGPIRSNLAEGVAAAGGRTGLNRESNREYVAAGVNPNYSKWLEVNQDEHFILVVDIEDYKQHGFLFNLHIKAFEPEVISDVGAEAFPVIEDDGAFDFVDMSEPTTDIDKIPITFKVFIEGSEEPVSCHAEVVGVKWSDPELKFDDKSEFTAMVPKGEWFFVNVKKEGYTFGTEKFKATDELTSEPQTLHISKMKAGEHIVLKEIVFRENTTHLLPSSINALNQLISFMNEYPSSEIEIQGHVNAPGMENNSKVRKFSLKRAEQVKDYLVDAGIESSRIKATGLGNEFMIYPSPKNYDQEKSNRRVEIEILKL